MAGHSSFSTFHDFQKIIISNYQNFRFSNLLISDLQSSKVSKIQRFKDTLDFLQAARLIIASHRRRCQLSAVENSQASLIHGNCSQSRHLHLASQDNNHDVANHNAEPPPPTHATLHSKAYPSAERGHHSSRCGHTTRPRQLAIRGDLHGNQKRLGGQRMQEQRGRQGRNDKGWAPMEGTGRQGREVGSGSGHRAAATTNEGQGSKGPQSSSNGCRRPRGKGRGAPRATRGARGPACPAPPRQSPPSTSFMAALASKSKDPMLRVRPHPS